jgi:hypothetical protein
LSQTWLVCGCFVGGLVFCGCFVGGLVFCGLWGLFSFCLSRLAQPFLKVEMVDKLKLGWTIFLWINVALKVSTLVRPIP